MEDGPAMKETNSFQETSLTLDGESLAVAKRGIDVLQPVHQKLDAILALLERWEQKSMSMPLDLPFSCPHSEEVEGTGHGETLLPKALLPAPKSKLQPPEAPPPMIQGIEEGAHSAESDNPSKQHRRLSAQNVLQRPAKARKAKEMPGASVDFATWTEQVRKNCHFDAGALSRGMKPKGSKEIERSQVPSISQMNGAFLQAVTMSKAERHAHFNQVEEHIDLEMERLGRKSEDEDEEQSVFPGLVPNSQKPVSQVLCSDGASPKNKVPTLVSLSNKSQAGILGNYPENIPPVMELGQRDFGSKVLLSSVARLFWIIGPLAILGSAGSIVLDSVLSDVDFRSGPAIAQLIYGLAALSTVVLLRMALGSDEMNLAIDKMQFFIADFMVEWKQVSGTEGRICVFAWVFMMLSFVSSMVVHGYKDDLPKNDPVHFLLHGIALLIFAFASFLVTLAAYVQSHILLGLDRSLDCWCCSILNDSDFGLGVDSWNCLQALLKSIGRGIASSFLALQIFGAIGLIYILASAVTSSFQLGLTAEVLVLEGVHALPLLVFFALNMRVCAHGAALTEKCRVIPAFVNQIPTEDPLDEERQYLVRYVADSSAGFFVKDLKLTREMFLKNFVTVGGLMTGAVGVLSRIY